MPANMTGAPVADAQLIEEAKRRTRASNEAITALPP